MRVNGYCPFGCGETLNLALSGDIMCLNARCPDYQAVEKILADPEHEHIVTFNESDFTIKHPLKERLNDELLRCQLHARIASWDGPPVVLGTFRAHPRPEYPGYFFEEIV